MSDSSDETQPPLSWFGRIARAFNLAPGNAQELKNLLRRAADKGLLDLQVLPLLEGAMSVGDMQVREIMVPSSQTVVISIDIGVEGMLEKVIESGHSRFPVIGDHSNDIRGILHAKDLLPLALADDKNRAFELKDRIRPAMSIPESKRLSDLLQSFRDSHNHMAVIVDEYGSVTGIVTIEDVLEQIVGDIADEHDTDDEDLIKPMDSRTFIVKALTPIGDFNDYFKTDFSNEEHETIGGIVLQQFGYMPSRGESVQLGTLSVVVLKADGRRVYLLRVSLTAALETPVGGAETD